MSTERTTAYDEAAIHRLMKRYCRAVDRMDKEMALACWHAGGTDDHAPLFAGPATEFVDFFWPAHGRMEATHHMIGQTLVELQGDEAGAETYWAVTLRSEQGGRRVDYQGRGRYVDTLAWRDGRWGIVHRTSIRDWSRTDEVPDGVRLPPVVQGHCEVQETHSRKDREDYSYRVLGDS